MNGITNTSFDPLVERRLGLDAVTSAALQARRYMDKYGPAEEQFALVSVKNHGNAMRNPLAHAAHGDNRGRRDELAQGGRPR